MGSPPVQPLRQARPARDLLSNLAVRLAFERVERQLTRREERREGALRGNGRVGH